MDQPAGPPGEEAAWDRATCEALIAELDALRDGIVDYARRLESWAAEAEPRHRAGAANLAHYLGMRRVDLARVQGRLARIGVSSLGRAESHVLANIDKVCGILHALAGHPWTPRTGDEPAGIGRGRSLLERNSEALLGPPPKERDTRIMVTMPTEAAADQRLVSDLVAAGMDIARINCAHDAPQAWIAMAERVRKAARRSGRQVRILMDLGGPKLRTGPIQEGPAVLRLKPRRDACGTVVAPAMVAMRPAGTQASPSPAAQDCIGVDPGWLAQLEIGDRIEFEDARGAKRALEVVEVDEGRALATCARTAYLTPKTTLRLQRRQPIVRSALVQDIPPAPGFLLLRRGDLLRLTRDGLGCEARPRDRHRPARPASIACTLPEALDAVAAGDRVWFDDGRIGGVVRRTTSKAVEIEITVARDGGAKLRADKGINLPDTALDLPALTAKDIADIAVVARHADLVGLSFAQSAGDVRALRRALREHEGGDLGIVLKIETRRGFENLPEMLFAAMASPAAGVMIARGDLAVECGYERMAEVQEEILWACEAAHLPVVWATQVLDTLTRTGTPSRAEITDAAMGERAECVMLNKGPYVVDAVRMLGDILRRMHGHQRKKRSMLRALKAWSPPPEPDEKPG